MLVLFEKLLNLWLRFFEKGQRITVLTPYKSDNAILNGQISQVVGTTFPSPFKLNIDLKSHEDYLEVHV